MTTWVRRLLVANVVVFFLENTVRGLDMQLAFIPALAFSRPWTFLTYMFVHAGLMHILFNMLALYFFGPRVEDRLGPNRFITLYVIAGVSGALLSMVFARNSPIVGASGAVFGVTLAFAWFWPTVEILIWGILPVQAWLLVLLYAGWSLLSGASGSRGGVADFAHLGGFVGAAAYLWWLGLMRGSPSFRAKTVAKIPTDTLANYKRVDLKSVHEVNRDEVNRLLDKINAKGLGSLTPQERVFLSSFVPMDDRVPPKT